MADEPGQLRVSPTLVIPTAELAWRFSRSGGPGGQHANRNATAVELRFEVSESTAFPDEVMQRIADRLGETVGVTGVALTKLDGSAKGGIAVAIAYELALPVTLIGVGEGLDDLRPFDPHDFARALVSG